MFFYTEKCFIIAEIGVNHNGDLNLAKKMIKEAKKCGADAVKFQTWITEENTSRTALKADYQKNKCHDSENLYDMIKRLELSLEEHVTLKQVADESDIIFFSRASSPGGLEILKKVGVPIIKIGSLDITYHKLIKEIAKTNLPIILSTGASHLGEIEEALGVIYGSGNKKVALLHCTSNYPVSMEHVNLKAIDTLKNAFHLPVGYSDHTIGIEVAIAAVAMGAKVIEKHFTLDRTMDGPDHAASLEPLEFKQMVTSIRNIEMALGDGIKAPVKSEYEMMQKMRRSVVALKNLEKGTALKPQMLGIKRPGTGLHPKYIDKIINKTIKQDVLQDEPITFDML